MVWLDLGIVLLIDWLIDRLNIHLTNNNNGNKFGIYSGLSLRSVIGPIIWILAADSSRYRQLVP